MEFPFTKAHIIKHDYDILQQRFILVQTNIKAKVEYRTNVNQTMLLITQ